MDRLTFRASRRQLRGLGLYGLSLCAVSAALLIAAVARGSGWGSGLFRLGIIVGIAGLAVLWSLVMYARAFTECTPSGIRTRGLAGTRECRWADVADVVAENAYGSSHVIVEKIAPDATRFTLGAPVAATIGGDPEFATKFAQIKQYWQAMGAGQQT